jgi:hypothetical protein
MQPELQALILQMFVATVYVTKPKLKAVVPIENNAFWRKEITL